MNEDRPVLSATIL